MKTIDLMRAQITALSARRRSRRHEVVTNRINASGHPLLTHGFLLDPELHRGRLCMNCVLCVLLLNTIHNILIQCPSCDS